MTTRRNWQLLTNSDLIRAYQDYYRAVHGDLPRDRLVLRDRAQMIRQLDDLDHQIQKMGQTEAGLQYLRMNGWIV